MRERERKMMDYGFIHQTISGRLHVKYMLIVMMSMMLLLTVAKKNDTKCLYTHNI